VSQAVRIERISSGEALKALRPEWDALLGACPGHALAVTPLWMGSWWEVYGSGRELCLLTAREPGGRLVGVAPLHLGETRHRGMLPFRRLQLLGAGEPQSDLIDSDYLDFIVDPQWEPLVTQRFGVYLFGQLRDSWDELILAHVPAESPRLGLLADAAGGAGLKCEEAERRAGVRIPLPETWEALLAQLDRERRKSLLRRRRRFAEAGTVAFDWDVTPANFEERWRALVDLHQRRWQALGRPGCFSSDRFVQFHRRVASELAPRGGLKIGLLRLDGRPIAGDYYYVYDGRVYAYQAGLDPEEGPRLSAGTVCISFGIETAIGAGLREYDFLKNVHSYKADWSPERREQVTLRVARPGAREQLRTTLESGIRLVRPLRRRLAATLDRGAPAGPPPGGRSGG